MTDALIHGFYADGVMAKRTPCQVVKRFYAACDADEAMTTKTDFYLTMFAFPLMFVRDVMAGNASLRGYGEACWSPFLWFDIDREDDLPAAIADTLRLVGRLICLGLQPQNVQVWFSGKKGFHVGVPIVAFGGQTFPWEGFAMQCKQTAIAISEEADVTIDRSVYDRVRLLRCPNTRHGATGLYKVPVTLEELREPLSETFVLERARQPRRLRYVSEGQTTNPGDACFTFPAGTIRELETIWQAVESNMPGTDWQPTIRRLIFSGEMMPRLRRQTLEFIRNGAPEGERANRLFQAAADCTRCGWSKAAIFSLLPDVAKQAGLSTGESERQIINGINNQKTMEN